jgi:hypothetical protein
MPLARFSLDITGSKGRRSNGFDPDGVVFRAMSGRDEAFDRRQTGVHAFDALLRVLETLLMAEGQAGCIVRSADRMIFRTLCPDLFSGCAT